MGAKTDQMRLKIDVKKQFTNNFDFESNLRPKMEPKWRPKGVQNRRKSDIKINLTKITENKLPGHVEGRKFPFKLVRGER